MKKPVSFTTSTLFSASFIATMAIHSEAATVLWGGSDGEYTTPSNWVGNALPNTNGGDTAQIDAGNVTYTPGGDLHVHSGGTLQINGGSWTQAGGIAWMQLAGETLHVNGGTFNQGTAGNIIRTTTTTILVSAGTANFNGNFINKADQGALTITGGTVNIANEFKPIDTYSMTTGSLNANLISFADGLGSINLSGGSISVNGGGFYSGFYGGGTKSLNFTSGSTGSLFFSTYTLADLTADHFLTNGTIQYNGAISASSFTAIETGGGVLITAVPETSSSLLLLGGIGALLVNRRRHQV